ncbi:hypothetical protein GCM10007853_15140 [Algimonas ampicilliniresistens]|uniref:Uncharacterized protein n=1 Tax=Algimonas ampicilliniresistens TaxID=1298735 RepID=A0ABQ5V8A6_9PROT|nr:hypothetical protein GCM10007853_15140 [Algimonas ampicilliniresistens]
MEKDLRFSVRIAMRNRESMPDHHQQSEDQTKWREEIVVSVADMNDLANGV